MDFDHTREQSSEAQESRANIYNVVLTYVVEMNEHRSGLYAASQGMAGVTPIPFREFLNAFYKLFTFTQSMLPVDLRNEIDNYFKNHPKSNDSKGLKGIELSLKMQKELENQRMITLYEETIVPPFVEITDEPETPPILSNPSKIPQKLTPKPPKNLPPRRG